MEAATWRLHSAGAAEATLLVNGRDSGKFAIWLLQLQQRVLGWQYRTVNVHGGVSLNARHCLGIWGEGVDVEGGGGGGGGEAEAFSFENASVLHVIIHKIVI